MSESAIELLRRCDENASRVNPESPHRKMLRQALRWYEMDVLAALLTLDRVAQLDPDLGPMDITALVRDARAAMQPLYVTVEQRRRT